MLRVACRPPGGTAMLPSDLGNYFSNGVLPNGGAQKPSPPSPLLPAKPLPLLEQCSRVHERVATFLMQEAPTQRLRSVQEQTRISISVIRKALRQYKLSELSLSYNGGKDCLVLLILYLSALHNHPELLDSRQNPHPLQSVYIQSAHPFAEVEEFVSTSSRACSLALSRYSKPMKAAFTEYLQDFPKVKAIFVGTRRTDPHGAQLTHFDPTDHGWPNFMRIHPVIDWHYVDIWTFIRYFNVPYCTLYDKGYTSLGGTNDTYRNPALRRSSTSASGKPEYFFRPAYELTEDGEERLGRTTKDHHLRTLDNGEVAPRLDLIPSNADEEAILDDETPI